MKEISDTGLIVALLIRNDPHHAWALDAFRKHAPFHTCDAVLVEAASFFPDPVGLLRLVSRGDVRIDPEFCLGKELASVLEIAIKYAERSTDLVY